MKKHFNYSRLKWWREARFGMIIHWGLYSIPAGEWNGQEMEYIGEWIMSRFRIPVPEYEKLALQFNPVKFDAEMWVSQAKAAGMKYIIYTAKHHDGFAMFHSASDPYNIVDATPFKRDPVAELAEACSSQGIKLCLYYSQALDWHEFDAGGTGSGIPTNAGMSWGNDWDFSNYQEKIFERYFTKKVKPQIKELLTQYGPIGAIWFDTPFTITKLQCEELYNLVRSLQPECIMNTRLGNGLGDYGSLGDNMIPVSCPNGDWEAVATLNDTWGYKKNDHNWKSTGDILMILIELAGKGVNYVLNIGPTEEGLFPEPCIKVLNEIGSWMDKNSESIYETMPTPFLSNLKWGPATRKQGKLYLHLHKWPKGKLILNGLRNCVKKAYILADRDKQMEFVQDNDQQTDWNRLEIQLPEEKPEDIILPVLALEFDGEADMEEGIIQQGDGTVYLMANSAGIHMNTSENKNGEEDIFGPGGEPVPTKNMFISPIGAVANWFNKENWLSWDFKMYTGGKFIIRIVTSALCHNRPWKGGHRVKIQIAGNEIIAVIRKDEESVSAATRYYAQATTICGEISIDNPGTYNLTLKAEEINSNDNVGLALVSVQLNYQ